MLVTNSMSLIPAQILCFMLAIVTFVYPAIPYAKVSNVDGLFPTERINDMQFGSWWAGICIFKINLMIIINYYLLILYVMKRFR